jgi:2-amino-4-hydroxy-6-hydroxymethyldihydropteridine diphosphokinase
MILVALGANLPGSDGAAPLETCRRAAAALDALPGLRLRGLSRWFLTAPIPAASQPPYVNAVAHLVGKAEPAELLRQLHAIEEAAGRQRGIVNAARILDLDLIAFGRVVRDAPGPVLPHPRAHVRGFVLAPLADVAPGWVHPRLGLGVDAMLAALPPQDFHPL